MDTATDKQHEDETSGAKAGTATSSPSPSAIRPPLENGFFAQCESCDELAEETDPPVTSTKAFRKGFCAAHSKESPKRPIEFWAKAKGMLPRMLEQGAVKQTGQLVPARQNPKHGDFHRARQGLPVGHEMTEEEFDKRVASANAHVFR